MAKKPEPLTQIRRDISKLKSDVSYLKNSIYTLLQCIKELEKTVKASEKVEILHQCEIKDDKQYKYVGEAEAKKVIEKIGDTPNMAEMWKVPKNISDAEEEAEQEAQDRQRVSRSRMG